MITKITGYNMREQTFGSALVCNKLKPFVDNTKKSIDEFSADYIKYHYNVVKKMCKGTVEINVESGRLQDIVSSCEPHIFILNHTSNQSRDVGVGKFFNTLLYREYLYKGKAENCPRSKVIANSGVLGRKSDNGDLYRKLGVVSVKAGLKTVDKNQNREILKELISGLANGKINLFIFPEGALAMFRFLPMNWTFQPGVSSIIKKVLELKDKIKVIPLGIAHNKKLSALHIGEPLIFAKKDKNYVMTKSGNAKIISHNNIPVSEEEIVPYISGTLVNELTSSVKMAKADLKNSVGKVYEL